MTAPTLTRAAAAAMALHHRGIRFQAPLHRQWAQAFDALTIPWSYLPCWPLVAGSDAPPVPGFYLPASKQFAWCTTLQDEAEGDFEKMERAYAAIGPTFRRALLDPMSADIRVVACLPKGHFSGYAGRWIQRTALRICRYCGGGWFHADSDSWRCQCCGLGQGNAHIEAEHFSPLTALWEAQRA